LIAGEPGIGKSWVCRRVVERFESAERIWLTIDLAPGVDPEGFLLALGHQLGLGIPEPWTASFLRIAIGEALAELATSGRSVGLVVDELQLAGPALLEELRVWANRMGRGDGLHGLVLSGQLGVLRKLRTREGAALRSRLARVEILPPIDADEALALVCAAWPARRISLDEAEVWHAEALGNPAELLKLASRSARGKREGRAFPKGASRAVEKASSPAASVEIPPLLPAKPPIAEADGFIEVGYVGFEGETSYDLSSLLETALAEGTLERGGSESIGDGHPGVAGGTVASGGTGAGVEHGQGAGVGVGAPRGTIRTEAQHGLATAGPHFHRLRPAHD
jgi:type II secretory pathway predicted ATPase ExeA